MSQLDFYFVLWNTNFSYSLTLLTICYLLVDKVCIQLLNMSTLYISDINPLTWSNLLFFINFLLFSFFEIFLGVCDMNEEIVVVFNDSHLYKSFCKAME